MKIILALFLGFTVSGFSQTIVFSEDFQEGISSDWILFSDAHTVDSAVIEYTSAWIAKVDPENANDTVASATSFFTTPADANRWLISPAITLSSFGNYIKWEAKSHDPSFTDDYKVLISTSNDTASFTDTVLLVYEENYTWATHEINLSELGYDNQTVYIAFVLNTYDGFKLYLDDIEVRSEDPVNVAEQSQTQFSVSPNPANDFIEIKSEGQLKLVRIFNQLGELVLSGNNEKINTSDLKNGIYFLHMEGEGFSQTSKLVVNH